MATDPVCGMAVDVATASHLKVNDEEWWFCSDTCRAEFAKNLDH